MSKILLVEDDTEVAGWLEDWFKQENFVFEMTDNGEDALQLLEQFDFDVIILDWGLPDITGLEVCRRYRSKGGDAPVLFLTGKGEIEDKEQGLDSGADDYLTKPFDVRELAARVRSLLRRPKQMLPVELNVKGVSLDLKTRVIKVGSNNLRLMPKECALLEFLMRHTNTIYSSKALLDSVWRSDSDSSEDTVRTCMRTLRLKLQKLGRDDLIKTILGSGYIIEVAPNP